MMWHGLQDRFFFFQAEDCIRDGTVTGVQTCALPILPAILERYPDTVYIVLGATHPHVKERHGETYRLMLESRAKRLGVDSHMIFHNRFVSQTELTEFLSAADIYVTPYLKPEQITS